MKVKEDRCVDFMGYLLLVPYCTVPPATLPTRLVEFPLNTCSTSTLPYSSLKITTMAEQVRNQAILPGTSA